MKTACGITFDEAREQVEVVTWIMATVEAVALFHERCELVVALMARQYGITDRVVAFPDCPACS